jgi:hypothetical protein
MQPIAAADENPSQPRAFVAQQQVHDLILIALISMHPQPESVMREFRELVQRLTGTATGETMSRDSFAAAVRRSADRFDRMVHGVLPALNAELAGTIASTISSGPGTPPQA